MEYLDIDYLKNITTKPYYFGLGFIQLKINHQERIHFWHPSLTHTSDEEEIHDHRYNFKSTILRGKLNNEIFSYKSNPNGIYSLMEVSCNKEKEGDPKFISNVDINLISSFDVIEGQSYYLGSDAFHKTKTNGCISLLNRDLITKDLANVIMLNNKELTCPFSIKLSEKNIWELIDDLINNPIYLK
jgi:hypothetical protein